MLLHTTVMGKEDTVETNNAMWAPNAFVNF